MANVKPQLASKDLQIISDSCSAEALAAKKCILYANYFQDPQLKAFASKMASHHRSHVTSMFDYLNSN